MDTQSDDMHCGGCGMEVRSGFVCVAGAIVCPSGAQECDGACVPLDDPNHCGTCDVVCCGGSGGCGLDVGTGIISCISGCACGEHRCGASCVDLANDSGNCGACGVTCQGGSSCFDSICGCGVLVDCDPSDDAFDCRDLSTDRTSCGACGVACAEGEACITAGGTSSCRAVTPTRLVVECPMTTFTAGASAVQCRALAVFGGGVPELDVTAADETSWPILNAMNGSCTGSPLCDAPPGMQNANGPRLGTTAGERGLFTPAGSMDPSAVTSSVIATVIVTWQRGTTVLTGSITLTTEPAT